jgi:selenium-binding protein 1
MRASREKLLYVVALYEGTPVKSPDYIATVDVDPASPTYSQVIHRTEMPAPGDELHHFGWNACSSCRADPSKSRRYLVVPGMKSSNIHLLDTMNPREPRLVKTIYGEEIKEKANFSAPHTVHCLQNGNIMVSMLGDAQGNGAGGFLLLDPEFKIIGPWERSKVGMHYNYDFWYQPRHNVMVSSEWGAPNTFWPGFKVEDAQAGKYGRRLQFWDWEERQIVQSVDLGETGMIPLEVRFHHDPDSTHGFVGAALSSTMWHWYKEGGQWRVEKVIEVPPVETKGWPFPVPGLITDLVL